MHASLCAEFLHEAAPDRFCGLSQVTGSGFLKCILLALQAPHVDQKVTPGCGADDAYQWWGWAVTGDVTDMSHCK